MLSNEQASELLKAAQETASLSFSPYSQFAVGAALLMRDGRVITGCNVESASYGLTLCAERTALVKAISEGHREPVAVAVWAQTTPCHSVTPCGACRQLLSEWLPIDGVIVMAHPHTGRPWQETIAMLLPSRFELSVP